MPFLLALVAAAAIWSAAQEYAPDIDVDHPAIGYFTNPVEDPVSRLIRQIENGETSLEFKEHLGYLPSLAEKLGINPDSQALVFSKTSFQAPRISPTNPRAIYFGDRVAIGYVPGAPEIEIASADPKQGVIFYTLKTERGERPEFTRGVVCLQCHQGPATSGVPGFFIGSVFPGPTGSPSRVEAIITDHRTKFEDRWGGWFINAARGQQKDRANTVASNPAQPELLDPVRQNITGPPPRVNLDNYLSGRSDIIAIMTFEHQTQMINYITRVGWASRVAEFEKREDPLTVAQFEAEVEALVRYMLFVDEVPLKEPIEGVSTFSQTFPQRGPRDSKGRSLRDFDLQTRLFRYPLSYVIYSESFDALPQAARARIYKRLHEILTGQDSNENFAKLTPELRGAIIEILSETKANLPEYWKKTADDRS